MLKISTYQNGKASLIPNPNQVSTKNKKIKRKDFCL